MFNRRRVVSCAICAAIGSVATGVAGDAQAQSAFTRRVIQKTEYPGEKYVCILMEVDLDPNAIVARHTHPGVESGYQLAGTTTLSVQGQPDRVLKVGDGYQIPPETAHSVRNGAEKSRLAATFIVEKDKPLASPAPE
jgi:quercetin dioxygenase-like cupin family protein